MRGALSGAVDRFCTWCEGPRDTSGRLVRRSLLRVAVDGGDIPRYGMFLGAGAIIQGTDYAHREIHSRGLRDDFSLALGTVRTAWGLLRNDPAFRRPVRMRLAIDGEPPVEYDTLILAISTLHRLAFGMRPFWGEGPGFVRLTLIENRCSRFARTFLSILRGRPGSNAVPDQGYSSRNCERVLLQLEGKVNLDGEILEPKDSLAIAASPGLEFLRL